MKINPMLLTDFYKISHRIMCETGTEKIYSTFTPRESRINNIDEVVFFGLQGFIKEYLIDYFNDNFFHKPKEEVINDYKRIIKFSLGDNCADTKHIEELYDIGYLPIKINALQEGTSVPIKVPMMTIENTYPNFYWLTNFLETLISAEMWKPITSTTIVKKYKSICDKYAEETCDSKTHVQWQCHNFSYRGMSGNDDAIKCGAGQLLYFTGTDTIPSICYLEKYYNANIEEELIGASVSATEHSIQCGYQNDEKYINKMLEIIPNGILSVVSDGYDYWNVLTNILPKVKDKIMNREGKYVVRPDSGNPVDIICGINNDSIFITSDPKYKGSIEILWDIFGGTINSKGYKVLDSHIGLIYGDAITPDIAEEIFKKLKEKGFASENVFFGIGSYSLGYYTRDTFSMAIKATYTVVDNKEINIFKNPKTDNGIKKSAKGRVVVLKDNNDNLFFIDNLDFKSEQTYKCNLLQEVFVDGKLTSETSLKDIREIVNK